MNWSGPVESSGPDVFNSIHPAKPTEIRLVPSSVFFGSRTVNKPSARLALMAEASISS